MLLSPNALEFMSSEESEKPRKSRKLMLERSKLTNIKKRLNDAHFEGISERQRRASAHVSRSVGHVPLMHLIGLAIYIII